MINAVVVVSSISIKGVYVHMPKKPEASGLWGVPKERTDALAVTKATHQYDPNHRSLYRNSLRNPNHRSLYRSP